MFSKEYWSKNWKSALIAAAFLAGGTAFIVAAVGCNTIEGFGKDIQRSSAGVRDAMVDN